MCGTTCYKIFQANFFYENCENVRIERNASIRSLYLKVRGNRQSVKAAKNSPWSGKNLHWTKTNYYRNGILRDSAQLSNAKLHSLSFRAGKRKSNFFRVYKIVSRIHYLDRVRYFIIRYFALGTLVTAILLGYYLPHVGLKAFEYNAQDWATAAIFLILGLKTEGKQCNTKNFPKPLIFFGIASVLLLTPLFSIPTLWMPISGGMKLGLIAYCCTPTALSTGVTLSQVFKGSPVVALLLTVITNLLGTFTVPCILYAIFCMNGEGLKFSLSPLQLIFPLIRVMFFPFIVGVLIRLIPGMPCKIQQYNQIIPMVSAVCLTVAPNIQISKSSTQCVTFTFMKLLLALCFGAAIHVSYLIFNLICVKQFSVGSKKDLNNIRKTVALVASQKSLSVAILIISELLKVQGAMHSDVDVSGAIILCVLVYIFQQLLDTCLANFWST